MFIEYLYKQNHGEDPLCEKNNLELENDPSHVKMSNVQATARSKVVAYDVYGCGIYDTDTREFYTFGKMDHSIKNSIDKTFKD